MGSPLQIILESMCCRRRQKIRRPVDEDRHFAEANLKLHFVAGPPLASSTVYPESRQWFFVLFVRVLVNWEYDSYRSDSLSIAVSNLSELLH